MSVFTHGGRIYEVTGSSPVDEDGYHYECWDLTPGSSGELGRIVIPEAKDAGVDTAIIRLKSSVTAAVLFRWMYFVPELQEYGINPED
jgi:hypothetical protein